MGLGPPHTCDVQWKQHNGGPAAVSRLFNPNGAPFDLAGYDVQFRMWDPINPDTLIIDAAATIVTEATGDVSYDPTAADTALSGHFSAEWRVTPSGGGDPLSFPNGSDLEVCITPSPI